MNRACPVVLRYKNHQLQLLAFKHPEAGNQLVKGNIKKGELLEHACIRELEEESGIQAQAVKQLGVWDSNFKQQIWGFCLMHYEGILPDNWEFKTNDDGGHIFSFFWQPLNSPLNEGWNELYKNAFQYIRNAVGK
ncbi:MAG: NUDIX domain-containing protein [Gammaproteobacteria bacterium]|nr:MAG: NUDIX domain-containing protein [Gammaproteobacteria bacterium]